MRTTRFAPSPTGPLHLGHAFAALTAAAAAGDGRFLLRMDDLDPTRCRREYAYAIEEDLAWLGLSWPTPVLQQSTRASAYQAAIDDLLGKNVLYPCFCTRKQVQAEIVQSAHAPHQADGPIYPGSCRRMTPEQRRARLVRGDAHVLRLDVAKAADMVGSLTFMESGAGPQGQTGIIAVDATVLGDIVVTRRDAPVAYHLAVVVDDAYQGVTLVTRGNDLFVATHVQRLLQRLLGLPEPQYAHHRLILDETGRKLSKRTGSTTLRELRDQGWSPGDIRRRVSI